jgi:hypothetical protein
VADHFFSAVPAKLMKRCARRAKTLVKKLAKKVLDRANLYM